jgi:hypothetical protein
METALAEDVSTVEKEQSMIDTTESDQVAGWKRFSEASRLLYDELCRLIWG